MAVSLVHVRSVLQEKFTDSQGALRGAGVGRRYGSDGAKPRKRFLAGLLSPRPAPSACAPGRAVVKAASVSGRSRAPTYPQHGLNQRRLSPRPPRQPS